MQEVKMLQELLGGGVIGAEDRQISINGGSIVETSSSPSPSSSEQQNLRCPRCDSSNTKFCYYNNYNLTQPRHFCKTCRRYWTKGGALRNVPIGGGCRKNKCPAISTAAGKSSAGSGGKSRPPPSDIMGNASFGNGYDQEHPFHPILWPTSHNSSHLSALLRAAQNPNPNPSSIFSSVSTLNVDPISQLPIGLCSSFLRNNFNNNQQQQLPQYPLLHHNLLPADASDNGVQEIYQRLKSSGSYHTDLSQTFLSNSASSALEPAANTAGEMGYCWNPHFSWTDLSTANGAFP